MRKIVLGLGEVSGCDSTISDSFNLGNRSPNHLDKKGTSHIHTAQMLVSRFRSSLMDTYISNSSSLRDGVDSKQSRVRIIGIESTDLVNKKNYKDFKC